MNVIKAGSTLHIVEPPKPHLWLVLTDPAGDPPSVVTVMLVSKKPYTDDTVVLRPGDHEFIDRETAVQFSTARNRRIARITAAMVRGRCALRASLSPEVLYRVQRGLLDSPYTVHAIRNQCASAFSFEDRS